MIKVPENGRKGVFVEVGAKALRGSVPQAFQKRGEHKVEQACTKLVPVDFWIIQGFGDLVQFPSKPKKMSKVPENGREGVCVEVVAKALRGSVPKACP